jgi:thioredoxin 1
MNSDKQPSVKAAGGTIYRWIIVVLLTVAIAAAFHLRSAKTGSDIEPPPQELAALEVTASMDRVAPSAQAAQDVPDETADQAAVDGGIANAADETTQGRPLPRLVDLGADKCIPCKMMAPILEQLRGDFAGRFEVVFIDVWKKRPEAQKYGIRVIPTQIFYDAAGKELFRHEGFFSREDILKTWRQYGFEFGQDDALEESS